MRKLAVVFLLGAAACSRSHRDPQASAKEPPLERLRQACGTRSGADCRELGRLYQDGEGVERSQTEAVRHYQLGCDAGDVASCHAAGQSYLLGAGVAKDVDRAIPLLTKACDGGDPDGCFKLGAVHAGGAFGPTIDEAVGFGFLVRACDLGLPEGCYRAGSAAEFGRHGGRLDLPRAIALYRAGCGASDPANAPVTLSSIGQASACWRLSVLHEAKKVEGPRQSGENLLRLAREYFSHQCDAGSALECLALGVIYSTGEGAVVDQDRAHTLFDRVCALQNPAACEQATRLRPPG